MAHLNKTLRTSMTEAMIDFAFSKKIQDATRIKRIAGEKVYQKIYSAHLIAMESLPKGWMDKSSYIYVAIGGQRRKVEFTEHKLIGKGHAGNYGSYAELFDSSEPVAVEYVASCDALNTIEAERTKYKKQISALLEGITTFKKLWEVWPDCKPILEKFEVKPTIAILPAVQLQDLNAALGLPVETQEAETV